MITVKKILFVKVFIALIFALNAAETVFIPENSYLLKENKKEKTWQIKATVQRNLQAEVIKKDRVLLSQEKPFGVCVDAYYLKIPGTDGLAYFPDITFKKGNDGKLVMHVDKIDSLMFLGILCLLIGLAALTGYFRLESEKKKYLLPASLLLFFWGYAFWYIGFSSGSFIVPTDDVHYYNIARKILALDFTSMKYRYTIGFPVLCIPFVLLSGMRDSLDFILFYMNFQTFILIPGLFLVLFRFLSVKLGLSRIQSFFVLLLWLILIVFYQPISSSTKDPTLFIPDTFFSSAFFSVFEQNACFSFAQCTWLGRNAMSDYAAFFLFVILLYAAMTKSRSLIRFSVLSMGFGFLCLIRINYILFAPLLAFVFYDSFSELWKDKRNFLYAALCGMAGFMLVVGWQLVLNKIQFGSPFIGPYSLPVHKNGPARGFGFDVIPYGFKFLCNTNYIYVILGISSLLFIPVRKTRVLLTLWIFPMLLFFFGYPGIFNNPTRFIFALYPAFSAAIVMNPIWKSAWNIRIKAVTVVVCLCVLCKSNLFYLINYMPWALGKYGVSSTAFVVIQCLVGLFCCTVIFSMRKELKTDYANTILHFRFLILFTAVFFLGSLYTYIAAILILAGLVSGTRDTWGVIRQINGRNGTDTPSLTA